MDYTICYSKDLASMQTLSLNKNGNKYYITLSDGDKTTIAHFDNKEDAKDKFLLINQYFMDGWGDFEYRRKKLLDLEVE